MKLEKWQVLQRQSQPLDAKILMSLNRIIQWYEYWGGYVRVSYSGGLDSTVLLHLARSIYPSIPATFVKALAYPEILQHVKRTDNVTIYKPDKTFVQITKEYGWPIISKRYSQYIREVQRARGETATKRLRLTGYKSNGEFSKLGQIPAKWRPLCDGPFMISDRCCYHLKKKPLAQAAREFGHPMIGIRATEAQARSLTYQRLGCNAFDASTPRSWPLAFWTSADIWGYIEKFNVPYSRIYDMGYRSTGCFACGFGAHLEKEPNRFQLMKETHPRLWNWCGDIGLFAVLEHINVAYR